MRDIAERTGLPQPYLEQILLALKGAGLVRSKRGVGGGYVLARPPDRDPPVRDRVRRRRADHARRLRRAAPGRRLRPRGPVRAARRLEAGRRAHAPPPRGLHARRRSPRSPAATSPWPAARSEPRRADADSAPGCSGCASVGDRSRSAAARVAERRRRSPVARVVERQLGGVEERPLRARAAGAAGRRSGRRRPGGRSTPRCTRIWWVRPVSSRQSSSASAAGRVEALRRTRYSVRAGLPSATTAIRSGSRAIAPDRGVDDAVRRLRVAPHEREVDAASAACAGELGDERVGGRRCVRATTSRPELPASRRCTMPGRVRVADAGDLGVPGEQPVDERARRCCRRRDGRRGPAGLSTTITSSSS